MASVIEVTQDVIYSLSGEKVKQISVVCLRHTEHTHDPGLRGFGTGTHVHGVGSEPDRINANLRVRPRTSREHPGESAAGHITISRFRCDNDIRHRSIPSPKVSPDSDM